MHGLWQMACNYDTLYLCQDTVYTDALTMHHAAVNNIAISHNVPVFHNGPLIVLLVNNGQNKIYLFPYNVKIDCTTYSIQVSLEKNIF